MGAPHHSKHIDKRPEPDEKLKYMLIVRSCTDKIRVYLSYVLSRAGFITVSFLAELVCRPKRAFGTPLPFRMLIMAARTRCYLPRWTSSSNHSNPK